mgnify:CR=1 FL=1
MVPKRLNSLLSCLLVVASCSRVPEMIKMRKSSAEHVIPSSEVQSLPPASPSDSRASEPEKLSLSAIATDADLQKNFDFAKVSEILWLSGSRVLFAHSEGKSLVFDFTSSSWSSVQTDGTASEFTSLYDFREAGHFGIAADVLNFKKGDGPIIRLKASEEFKTATSLGANPGFIAYLINDQISAIVTIEDQAKLYTLAGAPAGLKLLYPCNSHCLVWGYSGKTVFLYSDQGGWRQLDQAIEVPAEETVARMAIASSRRARRNYGRSEHRCLRSTSRSTTSAISRRR